MPRSPWPFQALAFRFAPVLVTVIAWNAIWDWATPGDPAWTPPPRERTVLTIGVFKTATDAPRGDGYAFETIDGRRLQLRCRPVGAAADDCLSGGGKVGDHSGRYATVRYYAWIEGRGAAPRLVLLGAKSGSDWLLRTQDQKARLTALGEAERRRKAHWRTAISAALTLAAGFIGLLLYRRQQR
ncbi:hypothetical protein G5B46_22465 [Caulobacter sp. 602-2]|uniref:Uncharacterized protein n=1 Tax=Caulobacter sp. 602-2 TaxID=2710887 RepID=A0A6G4R4A3_9CAUL|nr:hypothetical protein [Caulobacter sp. 602-2]NGM52384.1 hypothetical protein [Caulobacter sp. 602-2]